MLYSSDKCENKNCTKQAMYECPHCDSGICEDCAEDEDFECPCCGEPLQPPPKKSVTTTKR